MARLGAWSKRNLSIHNWAPNMHTVFLLTVDCALSAAPAPTLALRLLVRRVTEFLWDGADCNKHHPTVDRATLARPHIYSGLNCPLVKHIADSRRVPLWTRALRSTQDWALFQPSFSTPWLEVTARLSPPLSFEIVWLAACQLVLWLKPTNMIVNRKRQDWASQSGENIQHQETGRPCKNTPALIHTWLLLNHEERVDGLTSTTVDETPHHTHLHTIQPSKPSLFLFLSPSFSTPWLEAIAR